MLLEKDLTELICRVHKKCHLLRWLLVPCLVAGTWVIWGYFGLFIYIYFVNRRSQKDLNKLKNSVYVNQMKSNNAQVQRFALWFIKTIIIIKCNNWFPLDLQIIWQNVLCLVSTIFLPHIFHEIPATFHLCPYQAKWKLRKRKNTTLYSIIQADIKAIKSGIEIGKNKNRVKN